VGTVVLLGAAVLLLAPATSSAQVRFGRFGGYSGGYSGYSPGYSMYGYSPYGSGYSSGVYYPGYSPYYPGYSNYGAWSYPNYSYPNYSARDYYSAPGMSYSNWPAYSSDTSSYSYGAPASTTVRDTAQLNVRLPDPNAEVWVEGKRTEQRGTQREFVSPPLNPDKNYTYEVRARWTENGQERERTKTVAVRANSTATIDFTTATNSRVDDIDGDRRQKSDDRTRPGSDKPRPGDSKEGTRTRPPDNPPPD